MAKAHANNHLKFNVQKIEGALVNINFFAILAKDLHLFEHWGPHDEYSLSVLIPGFLHKFNYLDPGMVVCHMSFTNQRDLGFDETAALKGYSELSVSALDGVIDH